MKLGSLTVKRRHSLIRILVDIFSVAALLYIVFIVYSCAMTIEEYKSLNVTQVSLDFLDWRPLILWVVLGVVVWAVSVVAFFLPRKQPKRFFVNSTNAVKFCDAVDVCISCVRLIALHALSEGCFLHMEAILKRPQEFSIQLVLDVVIIALLLWFTVIRLQGISENAKNAEEEKRKERHIVED